MENMSSSEMLNFAIENGMIDIDTIRKKIEMNERKKYLEMHKSKIWQSTDDKWYTFVPDCTKKDGRRLVKRKTKEDIDDFLVKFYKDYEEPQTIEKTYYEWIDKKLKFEEITKQSADRYECDFNKYFSCCKNMLVRSVSDEFLDDFILANIKKYDMKPKAWSNLRTILRGMLVFAKKKGHTQFAIAQYLQEIELSRKLFNRDKKSIENSIFSDAEVKILVEQLCYSDDLRDLAILFGLYTGMRVGEIVALKWQDVEENFIHVRRTQISYKSDDGKLIYEIRDFPKTEAGIRDVVVIPELQKVIKRIRRINAFAEYVFENNGECISKKTVCSRLYTVCRRNGFPKKGMHSLRKYYATTLINAGVEESIIISQMGHADFSTTKKFYYKNNFSEKQICEKILKAIG